MKPITKQPIMKNIVSEIKAQISNGDIDIALKYFSSLLNDNNLPREKINKFEKSFILLSSQFSRLNEIQTSGTSDYNEFKVLHAQFISALLNLIIEFESSTLNSLSNNRTLNEIIFRNEDTNTKLKSFKKDYSNIFHESLVLPTLNDSQKTIIEIYNKILTNKKKELGYWVDNNQVDDFSLIYTNTSVLYFLIQLGFNLTEELCEDSVKYLDSIKEISIENRAKWYFDIHTNRISSSDSLKFLSILEENQIINASQLNGAFKVFRQTGDKNKSSNIIPSHYGGYTFHACYITDILMHLNPQNKLAKIKAIKILTGTRTFLCNMSDANDGFLLDGDYIKNSEFTIWFYCMCEKLGSKLPNSWRENIFKILTQEEDNMFRYTFIVIDLSRFIIEYRIRLEKALTENIYEYFERYHENLLTYLNDERNIISNRDLSIFGRALIYANKAIGNLNSIYNHLKI
jgi:hypothetical protein